MKKKPKRMTLKQLAAAVVKITGRKNYFSVDQVFTFYGNGDKSNEFRVYHSKFGKAGFFTPTAGEALVLFRAAHREWKANG